MTNQNGLYVVNHLLLLYLCPSIINPLNYSL